MDSMASCKVVGNLLVQYDHHYVYFCFQLGLSVVCLNVNFELTNICDGNEFYFVILYMRVCMCMSECMHACMHVSVLMMFICLTCRKKLAYFRIKQLKNILSLLGLSKQGKKQVFYLSLVIYFCLYSVTVCAKICRFFIL